MLLYYNVLIEICTVVFSLYLYSYIYIYSYICYTLNLYTINIHCIYALYIGRVDQRADVTLS